MDLNVYYAPLYEKCRSSSRMSEVMGKERKELGEPWLALLRDLRGFELACP